ncbi:Flagellum-specific peptidoglycan hydrolase FlgJ [Alkalibacterium subtropicum]|uniref:Peptidoglycan hydrolase n=1 Tax=Alkalibacterium subtropicum TaxID=753702 RepID=A0A1I1GNV9_9LACT|nr:LysM peptidoglycan-binding domain-containing protein [Alkalibacterium subtropicum]SFC13314.1 Flagellum-specific peptidoglycan hydrolase FlgJ [Alkalibacterium subtropicum]
MTKRQYMPLEPKAKLKIRTRFLFVSTGILAGLITMSGTPQAVDAEGLDVDQEKLQELYEQYHQIDTNDTLDSEAEGSLQSDSGRTQEDEEELKFIKKQLIKMIELAGGHEILEQLHNHSLSYDQLDTIFTILLNQQLNTKSEKPVEIEKNINDAVFKKQNKTDSEKRTPLSITTETDLSDDEKLTGDLKEENEKPTKPEDGISTVDGRNSKTQEKGDEVQETETSRVTTTDDLEEPLVYVVKSGDTLGKIAQTYGTTVNTLAALNKISDVNRLSVGHVLAVNEAGKEEARKPQPTKPSDLNNLATPAEFVENISGYAQRVASEQNLYASVMIAQASLESGYGKSSLSAPPNHNLFGIKGTYNGQSVAKRTQEYYKSTGWITIIDDFKKYPSYEESLQDNADLLRRGLRSNGAFYSGTWAENTTSYRDATLWLQGRYATDPTYASKLNRIIEQFDLTRFDIVELNKDSSENNLPDTPENPFEDATTYQVVSGDTLSRIAQKLNTTLRELKTANKLTGDLIFVGQELVVPAGPTGEQSEVGLEKPEHPADHRDKDEDVTEQPDQGEDGPTDVPVEEEKEGAETASTADRYKVVSGDTLSKIAKRFSTTVSQLKQWNRLTGDVIYVGQKLTVSAADNTPEESKKPMADQEQSAEKDQEEQTASFVRVVRGDTLSQIAKRYGTTVAAIQKANKLLSDRIYVGQRLTLPDSAVPDTKPESERPVTEKEGKPETPEVVPPSSDREETSYVVKSGDTLGYIARRFETTVARLKERNGLSSDLIRVRQRLSVPVDKAETAQPEPSKPAEKPVKENSGKTEKEQTTSSATYTVKSGDTLSRIARHFESTVSYLKSVNKLTTDIIFVGQKLTVRESVQEKEEEHAAEKPAESSAPEKNTRLTYQVKAGDTLSRIAKVYKVSVSQLKKWNALTSDIIFVGQNLTVNVPAVEPERTGLVKSESEVKAYTVKAGDTLSHIAKGLNLSVSELKEMNGLKSDLIFVNQRLTV